MADSLTTRWIKNASDERAVANGCRFDERRGQHVIDFAEKYLRLYEGDFAGQPFSPMEWQREAVMRMFGWVKLSARWGREIRRFNRASIWACKKNGKSPFLAWLGLYLLTFDGEQGQKVFFGAKDGGQARDIAGKHALEMVLASPELLAECRINRTLMQITHEPTRSTLKPMSSGDARTQQSKEGINGSILIDETHVVDREFISRVSRAGISRSEPFHIEVSTAGQNPDSYGKFQFDRGGQVERGEIQDEGLLHIAYAAPQDLDDADLAADPVKYGRMANPAWGITIDEQEFLSDYNRSKSSVLDFADFKTYRLNIWQRSKSPWLRAHDWSDCAAEFSADDFAGQPCTLGLDKSKTRDMTALVATFKRGDEFYQLPHFWLPAETARANAHLAAFLDWANCGALDLIPGEVIEDRFLLDKVAEWAAKFRIVGIYYDRTFASDVTLAMQEQHGIERVEFPQTTLMFTAPICDFERLVIQGKLRHPNNPVMTWQIGHCEAYTDSKARKLLIKPKHNDHRKIDGCVASVMSLYGAMQPMPEVGSVYETRGIATIGASAQPASHTSWFGDDDDDF